MIGTQQRHSFLGSICRPLLLLSAALLSSAAPSAFAAPQFSEISRAPHAGLASLMTDHVRQQEASDGGPNGLPSVTPQHMAGEVQQWNSRLSALNAINAADLSEDDQINAAVLRALLEADLARAAHKSWEMPFNSDSNFWTYLDRSTAFQNASDADEYLARLGDIPRYFDEHIANMQRGLKRGFSVPRISLEGRDASIAAFVTDSADQNAFYAPFRTLPSQMSAADQAALRAKARQVIEAKVIPAYAKLLKFFREEYLPRTRTSISVEAMPNGKAYYAAQIKEYSTINLSAAEIHQIGLSEVARIAAEMQAIMAETGFEGSLKDFTQSLRSDPRFIAKTPDELMGVSAYVAKRADGQIANVIGHLPRRRFAIRPVPDALAPFYTAGRGGLEACWMNTHALESRPLYNIPALTLHECSPGHSLQAALAEERQGVHDLRRSTYFSGFGEGWGLYSEWLGIQMGIYRTPYEHFGRLSYEMWRAARLVIDTGLHEKGWSRDQAIAYLADHTALSRHEVETEVDRYISWPGQALAYKLGEMTIRRLRHEAETKLGSQFDQRIFHDLILSLGSVPLPVLEQRIAKFIADGGKI